jgi:hypothetical protein
MAAHLDRPIASIANHHSRHGPASVQFNLTVRENVFSWMHAAPY